MNNNTNLLLNQANFQYSQGKYQEAVSFYRKIIKIDKKTRLLSIIWQRLLKTWEKPKKQFFILKKLFPSPLLLPRRGETWVFFTIN